MMIRVNSSSSYRSELQERAHQFAQDVRNFIKKIPRTIANLEDGKQLVRSSGSIGANYIEANESLGKKDFLYHIRISRKESKESMYWLRLIDCGTSEYAENVRLQLIEEAHEFLLMFSSIIHKKAKSKQ